MKRFTMPPKLQKYFYPMVQIWRPKFQWMEAATIFCIQARNKSGGFAAEKQCNGAQVWMQEPIMEVCTPLDFAEQNSPVVLKLFQGFNSSAIKCDTN